jgi:hypothetical protein
MLHFEVVWLDCAFTVEKKSVLPDDNFKLKWFYLTAQLN